MELNRRDFTRVLAGGAGALLSRSPAMAQKPPNETLPSTRSTFKGVSLGVNSYSLPELPLEDAIKAFAQIGFGLAELHPRHVEPTFGSAGPGGRSGRSGPPPTPVEAATAAADREKLRNWRLTVPLEQFEATGKKFKASGLHLYAYNMNFRDDFTDEELDRTFQMTHALGCNVMTAVGSKQLFKRLDPFAQKHKIWVAVHNEGNSIPTIADFDDVLKGASPYTRMTLDIGHFVASNSDPIECLDTHHDKILNLHLKDRKKNNGPNLAFGSGDTPIKTILQMDRDRKYHIPAQVEWEVRSENRVEAVRACFEYCKNALES